MAWHGACDRTRLVDVSLLVALVVLTAAAQPYLLTGDTLVSVDTASQYYPWYAFLGENLRAGRIPGWNPATFSGAPFAADPLSGWTYLPAMMFFAGLPLAQAAKALLVFHPLLAAWSTYALARALGFSRAGAFVAGLAYANTGFVQIQNVCCAPVASIYAWLPLTLLGAEYALRSTRTTARLAWWGLAGLGVSQTVAVWPGQGAYYAALIIGGYIAYRALIGPAVEADYPSGDRSGPFGVGHSVWAAIRQHIARVEPSVTESLRPSQSSRAAAVGRPRPFPREEWLTGLADAQGPWLVRIARALQHEAGVFAIGAALAAAGLLPRVEFNALSNLAGGYMGENLSVGGLQPSQWIYLATPGGWYVGLSVLALAAAAPFVVRCPIGSSVWYFGFTSVGALLLTGTVETPLHWLLYHLLPGFANLHPHAPERILTVAYLGPAMLAGATISVAGDNSPWIRAVSRFGIGSALVVTLVVVMVTVDLAIGGARARADRLLTNPLDGIDRLAPVDLATYYQATPAGAFLQKRLAESPGRFLGYAPNVAGRPLAYTFRFVDPSTAAVLVNNHALPLGLQDVQGYDASHLRRYDAYLAAINGQTQNYHDASIFPNGLSSPLLDLLNARYIVVPAHSDALDVAALERFPNTVYADRTVRILENPSALPRVWIVHAATQVAGGGDAGLLPIANGSVDARQTALLEEPPPPLEVPADPADDQAVVVSYEANRLGVHTSSDATGLLVLSEVYYPAWKAYVDGRPTPLYVADGALRAVPLPVGEHAVELRFESETLRAGTIISSAAALGLAICCYAAARRRFGEAACSSSRSMSSGGRGRA